MSARVEEGSVLPGRTAGGSAPCRWLIALDYDGTLRREAEPPIDPSFWELMRAWRSYGVRWGINTGRSLPYLCEELLPAAPCLPDFICTTERYAYVSDAEGCLRPLVAPNAEAREANLRLRSRLAPLLQRAMSVLTAQHPELRWTFAARDPLSIEAEDAATLGRIAELLQPVTAAWTGVAIQRAGRYMRLSDARYHKGTALALVARAWAVPAAHLLIAGDGHNDLDAFRHFPEAFCACPVDAHPEVRTWLRAHGGYVSPDRGVVALLHAWWVERVLPSQQGAGAQKIAAHDMLNSVSA